MNPSELKFCIECRHFDTDEYGLHWCLRSVRFEYDLVTGTKHGSGKRYNCREERHSIHGAKGCGKEGKFFSPREVKEEKSE